MAQRILITGAIAHHPLGGAGNAWAFLQYVLGFRRLGFDTYYAEHLSRESCFDDRWQPVALPRSANAQFFAAVMEEFDLTDRAALFAWDGDDHVGLSRRELEQLASDVDLLINMSGRFHLTSVLGAVRRRLYLDLDPGFTQIWQERYGVDMNLRGHDVHATVGLNLGQPDCPLPTCGLQWQTTLPPVVLDGWRNPSPPGTTYTTVADWRGYSPVEWQGRWYGQKCEEFLRLMELPRSVTVPLELCLAIHPDEPDRARLEESGWRLVDPRRYAATPAGYRSYILQSRGEFTAVKHGYRAGRTAWFSDRSACYLAAGRPVVIQDTGIGAFVPTGQGVLTFGDGAEAKAALDVVEAEYGKHAAAALAFASEFLDSDRVLMRLWELATVR